MLINGPAPSILATFSDVACSRLSSRGSGGDEASGIWIEQGGARNSSNAACRLAQYWLADLQLQADFVRVSSALESPSG